MIGVRYRLLPYLYSEYMKELLQEWQTREE